MTETTPRSESSPAGRLINTPIKEYKPVHEAPRLDSSDYTDGSLGGDRPKTPVVKMAVKKGWSP